MYVNNCIHTLCSENVTYLQSSEKPFCYDQFIAHWVLSNCKWYLSNVSLLQKLQLKIYMITVQYNIMFPADLWQKAKKREKDKETKLLWMLTNSVSQLLGCCSRKVQMWKRCVYKGVVRSDQVIAVLEIIHSVLVCCNLYLLYKCWIVQWSSDTPAHTIITTSMSKHTGHCELHCKVHYNGDIMLRERGYWLCDQTRQTSACLGIKESIDKEWHVQIWTELIKLLQYWLIVAIKEGSRNQVFKQGGDLLPPCGHGGNF